jgi:hypothetical protein
MEEVCGPSPSPTETELIWPCAEGDGAALWPSGFNDSKRMVSSPACQICRLAFFVLGWIPDVV